LPYFQVTAGTDLAAHLVAARAGSEQWKQETCLEKEKEHRSWGLAPINDSKAKPEARMLPRNYKTSWRHLVPDRFADTALTPGFAK